MKNFKFKEGVAKHELSKLHHNMLYLLYIVSKYAEEHRLNIEITSLIGDRDGIKPSSTTHSEGRAVDISVRGWDLSEIEQFVKYLNSGQPFTHQVAAISASDFQPRAAIYHDAGYGAHIHLQVRR